MQSMIFNIGKHIQVLTKQMPMDLFQYGIVLFSRETINQVESEFKILH